MTESDQTVEPAAGDALIATGAPQASLHQRLAVLVQHLAKDPVDCPVKHHFSPGVYARELIVPANVTVVGKVHKHENMLIMSQGTALLLDPDGEPIEISAGYIGVAPPGTQRAVHALTDCKFISVHGTHKTDLAEIEEEFIAQDMLEYEQFIRLTHAAEGEK